VVVAKDHDAHVLIGRLQHRTASARTRNDVCRTQPVAGGHHGGLIVNKPIGYSTVNSPDARWSKGPRVRVETLARNALFLAIDGERYRYARPDGALSGVHHVTHEGDHQSTSFAGCAEVVALEEHQ
jgi:hypothetical protein